MELDIRNKSRTELRETFKICNFITKLLGFSLIDPPETEWLGKIRKAYYYFSSILVSLLVSGELAYVVMTWVRTYSIVETVSTLHLSIYGAMSIGKLCTIWYKKDEFRKILNDLTDLWPTTTEDDIANETKRKIISQLRVVQIGYTIANIMALSMYESKPFLVYYYHKVRGEDPVLGYIWQVEYPFDKTKPTNHILALFVEAYTGIISVMAMISSDLCFIIISNHISMLLRLLQVKIRNLATLEATDKVNHLDLYDDIVSVIKTHQRLISYGNDIENAFSFVNLINVVISSIEICCVAFDIVIEPLMEMSNKVYLLANLAQVGIFCWYAQEITTTSKGIADAAYECKWYNFNIRSRKAILILLQRSQKPLHFTAYKFRPITMSTYSSILATSYSYFTLLYTMYRSDAN